MSIPGERRAARLRLLSNVILIAGLLAGLILYWSAAPPSDDPLDGPENSKQYLRQMQVYGGQANVIAEDVRQGLEGLFVGRRLAFTVAVLALVAAAGCRFAAIPLPSEADAPGPTPRTDPGNSE